MKKKMLFFVSAMLMFALGPHLVNAGCDTVPDPGQMVGKCNSWVESGYTIHACTTTAEDGSICYFGTPTVQ